MTALEVAGGRLRHWCGTNSRRDGPIRGAGGPSAALGTRAAASVPGWGEGLDYQSINQFPSTMTLDSAAAPSRPRSRAGGARARCRPC